MIYIKKTDSEIKEIAKGIYIYIGSIFSSVRIQDVKDISVVFIVLAFMDSEHAEELKKIDIGMLYEYMSQALPRCINSMPIFTSVRILDVEDTKKVMKKHDEIKETIENI